MARESIPPTKPKEKPKDPPKPKKKKQKMTISAGPGTAIGSFDGGS